MALWLVRHARVQLPAGLCYGRSEVAADPEATAQAAQALAMQLPQHAVLTACSALGRCRQLAQALVAHRPGWRWQWDVRLQEMDFGCWELQSWADIPAAALQAWTDDFGQHRFGGIESAQQVLDRVASAWDALPAAVLQAAPEGSGPQAVWVTHAGVIRAATLLAAGVRRLSAASQWPMQAPGFGQWTCLQSHTPH